MKKTVPFLLAIILLSSCKSSWNLYKPAQSDIVGKAIIDYKKKNQQIAFGSINTTTGTIETKDSPSSASENLEIEKNLTLDLKGFFNKKTKVTKVDVTNATVTNISSVKDLKPGRFVYSAVKADKVVVTIKNESETDIKPKDLVEQLETYVRAINPAIVDAASIINEIKFDAKNESKYEITNPNVYYLFQEAELLENQGEIKNKWFQNFAKHGSVELTAANPVSKIIYPVISKNFKNKVDRIGIQLVYKLEDKTPELYVRYTTVSGEEMKKIPRFSDNLWDKMNFVIKEYNLSSNSYKVVRMEIKAKQTDNGISVNLAKVSYPEKVLKINQH